MLALKNMSKKVIYYDNATTYGHASQNLNRAEEIPQVNLDHTILVYLEHLLCFILTVLWQEFLSKAVYPK